MTWIRFECDCPEDPLWEELAGSAGCNRATAFLAYWTMVSRMAKAHPSGQLDQVSDAQIEAWAGWRGKSGRWARAVRRRCQEPAGSDHVGVLRGWWRNLASLAKQAKDAKKRRPALNNPPKTPGKPPENPRGFLEGTPEKPPENPRATLDIQTPSKSLRSLEGATPAESGGVAPPRWTRTVVA